MRNFDYRFLAHRQWDSEIVSYVAKIHERKGRQDLYVRQKPVELNRLTEIARVQSTESSNKIEGIVTTNTRVKQLVADKTAPRNRDEREIVGYRDVLNTIHASHDFIPLQPNFILQLHRDLLRHTGLSYGGRFKNVQNYISETKPDGTQITRFTPVAPHEVPSALESACQSYAYTHAMEIVDPLILIPVFICDFLCIHPFNDGNGRMSRLLTLLLLYQDGLEVGKYVSIEKEIERTKDDYYNALECANHGWNEGNGDYTPFIRYMLQVILSCYVEFEERVSILQDSGVKSTAYDVVKSYAASKLGKFTSAEAVTACPKISRSSVMSALKKLVDDGYLVRVKAGRNVAYARAESVVKNIDTF